MKEDNILFTIIKLLLITRILWILLFLLHMYLVVNNNEYDKDVFYIEEIIHTLFTCLLGILLVYLFHYTSKQVCIKGTAKKIIFILGIILILGAIKKIVKSYYKYDKLDFLDEIALKI